MSKAVDKNVIQRIYARSSVGISDLKRAPADVIKETAFGPIVIFNRNVAVGYLVSPESWAKASEALRAVRNEDDD